MKRMMAAAAILACALTQAAAQNFPNRPVKILVGFPAGGPSDVPARLIADKLQKSLGQPVVVENKTGAAGMIALNEMLAHPRDGHTLLLCSYIDAANPLLYKKVAYKLEDLGAVSLVTKAYYAFTVPPESPASDVKSFVAHAKTKELNYGKVGSGSVTELLPKQFEKITGIKMTGVTFRGTGPALQEVVAGRIDLAVSPIALAMPMQAEKKVKILGMTSPERLAVAPDVPTLKEQGLNIDNYGWWGVCAPSGVPKPVIDTLNQHVRDAVASDDFKSVMERAGTIPTSSTPEQLAALIAETAKESGAMFKELGIEQLD
ncbi:MAG: tripartite tricarboxylate transporter substrate binding protein [Pseudolabrys sp.]|nr:tripartite tricarboxylate transporter substrate binding protein [Pseudolabrys sp.]